MSPSVVVQIVGIVGACLLFASLQVIVDRATGFPKASSVQRLAHDVVNVAFGITLWALLG